MVFISSPTSSILPTQGNTHAHCTCRPIRMHMPIYICIHMQLSDTSTIAHTRGTHARTYTHSRSLSLSHTNTRTRLHTVYYTAQHVWVPASHPQSSQVESQLVKQAGSLTPQRSSHRGARPQTTSPAQAKQPELRLLVSGAI